MAAEEWTIGEVRLVEATRIEVGPEGAPVPVTYEEWEIDLDTPNGRLTHFLPVETVAWRIAEYGLDPDDPEHHALALDIALHEPHIPPPEEPQPRGATVQRWTPDGVVQATDQADVRVAADVPEPYDATENLLTAETLDSARETHLAQIELAKERVRIVPPAQPEAQDVGTLRGVGRSMLAKTAEPSVPSGPLDWMLQHAAARLDPDDVEAKRTGIEQARQSRAQEPTPSDVADGPTRP